MELFQHGFFYDLPANDAVEGPQPTVGDDLLALWSLVTRRWLDTRPERADPANPVDPVDPATLPPPV